MIEFRQVSRLYPRNHAALSDVSLTIARGEWIYLTGPSGAGKSTLLKLIAGIERPTSGVVAVNGQDLARLKSSGLPYLRRKLGLMFQQQTLLNDRSVLANVALPLLVSGTPRADAEKRARAALDKVGLLEQAASLPLELSGGEQQRAAVARAIVNRPQIILADEPTANLDRVAANRVMDALRAFHGVGVTCLVSTHDEVLLREPGRVIHLDRGRVVDPAMASEENTQGAAS